MTAGLSLEVGGTGTEGLVVENTTVFVVGAVSGELEAPAAECPSTSSERVCRSESAHRVRLQSTPFRGSYSFAVMFGLPVGFSIQRDVVISKIFSV